MKNNVQINMIPVANWRASRYTTEFQSVNLNPTAKLTSIVFPDGEKYSHIGKGQLVKRLQERLHAPESNGICIETHLTLGDICELYRTEPLDSNDEPVLCLNFNGMELDSIQRAYITAPKKASLLLVGLLQDDQIMPQVISYLKTNPLTKKTTLRLADGMQRICTIIAFILFGFKITGTHTPFDGLCFNDLTPEQKQVILGRRVSFRVYEFFSEQEFKEVFRILNANKEKVNYGELISGWYAEHPLVIEAKRIMREAFVCQYLLGKDKDERKVGLLSLLNILAVTVMGEETKGSAAQEVVTSFLDATTTNGRNRHAKDLLLQALTLMKGQNINQLFGAVTSYFGDFMVRQPEKTESGSNVSISGLDRSDPADIAYLRTFGTEDPSFTFALRKEGKAITSSLIPLFVLVVNHEGELAEMELSTKHLFCRRLETILGHKDRDKNTSRRDKRAWKAYQEIEELFLNIEKEAKEVAA